MDSQSQGTVFQSESQNVKDDGDLCAIKSRKASIGERQEIAQKNYKSIRSGATRITSSIVVRPAATFSAPLRRNGRMPSLMACLCN